MVKSLIKLGLILVVGILIYNYFFGTVEEKAQSKEIFTDIKDLTSSAFNLLKSEKKKFDEGKYDEAVDKVGGLIDNLESKAKKLEDNKDLLDQLGDLQRQKDELEERIDRNDVQEYGSSNQAKEKEKEAIERDWEDLIQRTERVMTEMERRAGN
ncbi:MAG TPA: hypothetical protein PKA00_13310 [Saprospiraceae bacterium]|nr:hypothetical protein [Saprospiraceae bacterium]HMQ83887.1 hypothetical protein [Saprospiraceae bacterium]